MLLFCDCESVYGRLTVVSEARFLFLFCLFICFFGQACEQAEIGPANVPVRHNREAMHCCPFAAVQQKLGAVHAWRHNMSDALALSLNHALTSTIRTYLAHSTIS